MNEFQPGGESVPESESIADLEARLARLRRRMAAEGRKSAVDALDKAIARESQRRSRPSRK